MVSVEEATRLVHSTVKDYGNETIHFTEAVGRILAEDITADRDLPPYNRVAMDGIAIRYSALEKGLTRFRIKAIQAAGQEPATIDSEDECIEIMTGAALHESADTVIRYEDLQMQNGFADLKVPNVTRAQSVHEKGSDRKQGQIIVEKHRMISPAVINVAASAGKTTIAVKKLPRVLIISTGNELVDVHEQPSPYEIRRSNSYTIKAVLSAYALQVDLEHLPDEATATEERIRDFLHDYDVILLSGGISMGKFDYVPEALTRCGVKALFHKVSQRPGKPFWFGKHENGVVVFAFPGNPVSTFMCVHRYLVPWLEACLQWKAGKPVYALLEEDVQFKPPLQYFLQVQLRSCEDGRLTAMPVAGNGSGDFANLTATDAFMELPAERDDFKKGEAFRVWNFGTWI
jgi:molybdopterin molybdotransferase